MENRTINLYANNQTLVIDKVIEIVSDTENYIYANVDLGENWQSFDSVRAIWSHGVDVPMVLNNGSCKVPADVIADMGVVKVNLVGSNVENDVLVDRLTTEQIPAILVKQNVPIDGTDPQEITPSQFEQYVAIVRDLVSSVKDIDHIELNSDYTLTIYYSDGTSDTTTSIRGADGNGIQSITKTGTSGLVDTYTITFTDGQTTTFTVTNGAKGDTGNGIQSIAKTSTVGLVDTYTITYTDGTTTTFTVTNGEKGDKGDTGEVSMSELEDATIVQTLSDTEPYHFRRTNNRQGAGHREYDEIVGASVGWNQLSKMNTSPLTTQNVTFTQGENGHITTSGTISTTYASFLKNVQIISGHKYLTTSAVYKNPNNITFDIGSLNSVMNAPLGTAKVFNGTTPSSQSFGLQHTTSGVDFTGLEFAYMLIDLTLFNSAIADYVYTLEQSTAGSGVAWLKSHFPKLFDNGYQPFDSGSIQSVSGLSAHEMVGKNLLDKEAIASERGYLDVDGNFVSSNPWRVSDYIRIDGNITVSGISNAGNAPKSCWYDVNKTFISSESLTVPYKTLTPPSGAKYIRLSIYNADIDSIQLELGSTATPYEPHEKHTYPLDPSVTLRGKYVLDNGQLKAVGDVWKSDGEITRNYSVVDLGTLNWGTSDGFFESRINDRSNGGAVCAKYEFYGTVQYPTIKANLQENQFAFTSNSAYKYIEVKDSTYSSASDFKTAMSGVMLVYELATPTTETATPYTNPQWCDSKGTEEYVGSELPVGHNTDYPMTLVDTMPSANGTYEPRVTIANGKRTITWVSV